MIENFIAGFMNGAFIVGSICGMITIGFAFAGLLGIIWGIRDLITKRLKSRKWG